VGASPWTTTSNDSAILITLPPGIYNTFTSGVTGDSGLGFVEIYVLP